MSQIKDLKRELKEAKKMHLSWRAQLLIFVIGAPMTFLLALYGRLALAMPLMLSTGVLGLIILFKRILWQRVWFWVTMAVIAALHVALILFVPWGTRWVPALALAGIASVDFLFILWILEAVGKFMGEQNISESRARSR